jgi:hypothetical protein
MSMKNSSDIIGNRIRDLPACGAVPQPAAPPAACLYKCDVPMCNVMESTNMDVRFQVF